MWTLFRSIRVQPGFVMLVNFLTVLVIYMLTRWFFYWMNISSFQDVTFPDMITMSKGGFRFDLSALSYINILCILMQFVPIKQRNTVKYQRVVKYIFLIVNAIAIFVNVADVVYFEFGGRRTTAMFFSEFGGESNWGSILLHSVVSYWQAWLFGIAMISAMILLYYNPIKKDKDDDDYPESKVYYPLNSAFFVIAVVLTIGGFRGGYNWKMHPICMDGADIYCKKPFHAAIVLNTPFTLLTTCSITDYENPQFFESSKLDSLFYPVCNLNPDGGEMKKYNVVMFLMEGISREYTGFYNHHLDNGTFKGYTPFLDSLISQSYSFEYSFANGSRSVDCMPASLTGIPRYIEPYCYYFYSNNTVQGLPAMLADEGYNTAFFHGAPNETMIFNGFTNNAGFQSYYGMDEYNHSEDFDGTWAIFDEPFLQYFAVSTDSIAKLGKPFMSTVFTATSHDPFPLPKGYENKFPEGPVPMCKTVGYFDYSLRRFFEKVKDKDWFKNTIFVFTADHTGPTCRDDFNNEMGRFLIPIFFYTPGGQLPVRCDSTRIMQQTDITPSLLSVLNYQKPVFSFGKNVFDRDSANFVNFVFNDRNGNSMYYLDTLMIEYRNKELFGIFDYKKDFTLQHNLIAQKEDFPQLPFMETQIRAIIQQYIERMKTNKLIAK